MIFLYIFLIMFAVASMIIGYYGRKKINECKSEQEKKVIKAKWQLISGLLGFACIIVVAVLIFTMF